MSKFHRFAVYYLPIDCALADFGAHWLGWDVVRAEQTAQHHTALSEFYVADVTQTPQKYGFHATLKPPFKLAAGRKLSELESALQTFAKTCPPVLIDELSIKAIGSFLALVPNSMSKELNKLAADCVTEFDQFRAVAGPDELERRRRAGLTKRQDEMLGQWGYPYVLDEFRFHMTLTGKLEAAQVSIVQQYLEEHMPKPRKPYVIDQIALVGERSDGHFELLQNYKLEG